jgi:hypothetical protein
MNHKGHEEHKHREVTRFGYAGQLGQLLSGREVGRN